MDALTSRRQQLPRGPDEPAPAADKMSTPGRCEFGEGTYRIISRDTIHSWVASQSSLDSLSRNGPPRVYLAGFEVFFEPSKQAAIAAAKKRICASRGLEGVFPGDAEIAAGLPDAERAAEIYAKDVELMKTCDAICANLTPFRGLSADAGTCWELGYFVGAEKPAVAYTNESRMYEERVPVSMLKEATAVPPVDALGMVVDMQGEPDNCMMTRGVAHLSIAGEPLPMDEMLVDLSAFEDSIARLAELFLATSARSCVMRADVTDEMVPTRVRSSR
jgi:nucleoside 2-deoxyribosyltransferase